MELNKLSRICYNAAVNKGFWSKSRRTPELLMLIVSELSEALEADRHDNKKNFNEEIADTFIRLFDLCGAYAINIEKEIKKKMEFNKKRPRLHGKRY